MFIKANGKYRIIAKGPDTLIYEWNLTIIPSKRAWKIVSKDLKKGDMLNGYLILFIEDVSPKYSFKFYRDEEDYNWKRDITEEEFQYAVASSNLGFTVYPSLSQSYRCDICGGIVANDICTDCMFDWDS